MRYPKSVAIVIRNRSSPSGGKWRLPLDLQAKLLTLVEEKSYFRVGSAVPRQANVRIIAASNRDLAAEVRAGRFRGDLLYRLNRFPHRLPSLRERIGELRRIVDFMAREIQRDPALPGVVRKPDVTPPVTDLLRDHAWEGNLRELRGVLEYAAVKADDPVIRPEHLPEGVRPGPPPAMVRPEQGLAQDIVRYRAPTRAEEERQRIVDALRTTAGTKTHAAGRLGMNRQTLWRKIRQYGIRADEWKADVAG